MELRDGGQHSTVQHYITPQQHHTQSACMPACFQENREALTLWYRVLRIDKPPGLTHFSKQGLYTLHTRLDKHTRPQSHLTHKHTRSQACTYQKHTSVRLAALQSMRTSMHLTNLLYMVTVLQSTEIKRGDQNQLAGEGEVGGSGNSEGACCGPAGPVMWIKAAENGLNLVH